jgi:hypothetical protein
MTKKTRDKKQDANGKTPALPIKQNMFAPEALKPQRKLPGKAGGFVAKKGMSFRHQGR